MTVTHIHHSCYTVSFGDYFFVFDYYKGDLHLPKNKKVVFVATHGHHDHFSKSILKMKGVNDSLYLLSSDIRDLDKEDNIIYLKQGGESDIECLKTLYSSPSVTFLDPDNHYTIDDMSIYTFGSTDRGISILIKVGGISIFHSGDLNFWAWESNTPEVMLKEEEDMNNELKKIATHHIDVGFFPVDPRLGKNYYKGPEAFIETCHPQIFFPLHMMDDFAITLKFREHMKGSRTEVRPILRRNDSLVIDVEMI